MAFPLTLSKPPEMGGILESARINLLSKFQTNERPISKRDGQFSP